MKVVADAENAPPHFCCSHIIFSRLKYSSFLFIGHRRNYLNCYSIGEKRGDSGRRLLHTLTMYSKPYEQAEIFYPNPPASPLRFNSSTPANAQKIEKSQYRKCNMGASKNAVTHFLRRDDFYIFYIGFFLFSSVCFC